MKFSIEIDNDSILANDITYAVSTRLAEQIYSKVNVKYVVDQANQEINTKKMEAIKNITTEVKSWDKASIILDLSAMLTKSWIKDIADKVSANIVKDPKFIATITSDIIKIHFTK
jgi:hypothetical protein